MPLAEIFELENVVSVSKFCGVITPITSTSGFSFADFMAVVDVGKHKGKSPEYEGGKAPRSKKCGRDLNRHADVDDYTTTAQSNWAKAKILPTWRPGAIQENEKSQPPATTGRCPASVHAQDWMSWIPATSYSQWTLKAGGGRPCAPHVPESQSSMDRPRFRRNETYRCSQLA